MLLLGGVSLSGVAFIIDEVLIVDQDGREILLQLVLEVGVATVWRLGATIGEWVACDVHHVDALSLSQKPEVSFILNHIEGNVKFLKLNEIFLRIQQIRVQFEVSVPRQIQPLQAPDLANNFEYLSHVDSR